MSCICGLQHFCCIVSPSTALYLQIPSLWFTHCCSCEQHHYSQTSELSKTLLVSCWLWGEAHLMNYSLFRTEEAFSESPEKCRVEGNFSYIDLWCLFSGFACLFQCKHVVLFFNGLMLFSWVFTFISNHCCLIFLEQSILIILKAVLFLFILYCHIILIIKVLVIIVLFQYCYFMLMSYSYKNM